MDCQFKTRISMKTSKIATINMKNSKTNQKATRIFKKFSPISRVSMIEWHTTKIYHVKCNFQFKPTKAKPKVLPIIHIACQVVDNNLHRTRPPKKLRYRVMLEISRILLRIKNRRRLLSFYKNKNTPQSNKHSHHIDKFNKTKGNIIIKVSRARREMPRRKVWVA